MNEEIMDLQKNETWERCRLPGDKKMVGCKWVFSVKYHADGIIERSSKIKEGIFINQRKYILDLLAEAGMLDCKPTESPMVANHGLQIVEGAEMANQDRYRRMVGKLIYLSHTRPNIVYAVGIIGLVIGTTGSPPQDTSPLWGEGGNLVTWKSKKQKVVTLSSAEAEFRGIEKGVTEIL
ncbi:uncharacterized mitochondrial protein AtMg00810-like [Amaranthus tricolor]|uniref:uncharacterized mitochondrial protein AtMg00810-like n=1 Tax=Amaranthus tricolor TaxID=29722 RepID=UPI00258DA7D2|nr:uncharacterized mitochondrial protein AtMg00810-like [Amaranthus tricolor]